MRKVAITGHRPDVFIQSHYKIESLEYIADNTAWLLKQEYGDELELCLGGTIGVDQWMGRMAIKHKIKYHLFLPFLPQIQSKYWNQKQKDELDAQLKLASGITIIDPDNEYNIVNYHKRNIEMINSSDFVVAFWAGKKQGGTFSAIKYALSQSKLVLNALDELRPIFKQDLKLGWTPAHMRGSDV